MKLFSFIYIYVFENMCVIQIFLRNIDETVEELNISFHLYIILSFKTMYFSETFNQ